MLMVLHACTASNDHSTILWKITRVTHLLISIQRVVERGINSIVSTQHLLTSLEGLGQDDQKCS